MRLIYSIVLLTASHTLATPLNVQVKADSVLRTRAVCTPASGAASGDDTPAIADAIKSCGNGGTIVIPAGTTYNLKTALEFDGCVNCDFQIEGQLIASGDTDLWDGARAIILVKNIRGVKIRSLTGSGVIDGNGQKSYDRFAKDTNFGRPDLLSISGGSDILVDNFQLRNAPEKFVNIRNGVNVATFSNLKLDATSESSNSPQNTDGFAVGDSTHVTLTNINVKNQDDCIGFKPGANYVLAEDITCTESHGVVVGSLGLEEFATVTNIIARNIHMINSVKAAGIKTFPPGNGHTQPIVSNVTFTGFVVENCDFAIEILSCYSTSASYCESHPGNALLTDITFDNFSGKTNTKYSPTTANLNCGAAGTCDVTVSEYKVEAGSGEGKVLCENTPSTLGIACTAGASG